MVIMQFTVIAFSPHLPSNDIFNFNESATKNHNFSVAEFLCECPLATSICGWIINNHLQSPQHRKLLF